MSRLLTRMAEPQLTEFTTSLPWRGHPAARCTVVVPVSPLRMRGRGGGHPASEVVRSYFRYLGSETIQQTRWPGCVRLGRTEGGGVGILHGLSAASLRSEHSRGGREREDVGWGGLLNLGQGGKNNCSAFLLELDQNLPEILLTIKLDNSPEILGSC